MKRFDHHAIAVCQGSELLFSAFEDQGAMWPGEGPRAVRRAVAFDESFVAVPMVHVAIAMWDIDGKANQRADICAENITRSGFDIVFQTWGDTRVARIRAEWLAIGAVMHEGGFRSLAPVQIQRDQSCGLVGMGQGQHMPGIRHDCPADIGQPRGQGIGDAMDHAG